jgi:hypothetical protein
VSVFAGERGRTRVLEDVAIAEAEARCC